MSLFVQFGCGLCAPEGWLNFDCSPTLRLQRLPLVGRLMPSGPYGRFPANVRVGDIVRGLPVRPASVSALYASHVLEHLCLDDLREALRNCRRIVRPDGFFRLVVPDLERLARAYLEADDAQAASRFMRETLLGHVSRPRTLARFVRAWLGNAEHMWMWDYKGLAAELRDAGFTDVRRAAFGDSSETAFTAVEDSRRWHEALGVECR